MTKRILVTGASRGIGRAIAVALANTDYHLVLHYRANEEAAHETLAQVEACGGKASLMAFDIADRALARELLEAELAEHGAFWGVICNAGIHDDGPFPGLSDTMWDRVIRTNLDGFYNVLRPLVMPMIQLRKGGRIVTLTSVSGLVGNRGQTNYAASKAGIIGASKSLALELAKRKITVNCVAPGLIETDMMQDVPREIIMQRIPMRRLGKPEEVAGVVRFLFSEEAAYMTGQVVSVNGGMV